MICLHASYAHIGNKWILGRNTNLNISNYEKGCKNCSCVVTIIGLASITGIIFGQSNSGSQASPEDYAILTYMPYSGTPYTFNGDRYSMRVYYGQKQVEYIKLTKEELDEKALLTAVSKLLGRLSGEGYTLISTNVLSINNSTSSEIHCFLKKVK